MYRLPQAFHHFFTFNARVLFVEYGDPSTPSHSYWFIPNTYEED